MEWIKVTDRLPEIGHGNIDTSDECLCYSDALLGKFFIYHYDYGFESWSQERGHDAQYNPITHWMPLPEPPTE